MRLRVSLCCAAFAATGCQSWSTQPPIEQFANKFIDQAVVPAVHEGLSQGVRQLTVQAGAQGINPTYKVKFAGKWVVGVEGDASIGVEGLAGQVQISSAGDSETPASPHAAGQFDLLTEQLRKIWSGSAEEYPDKMGASIQAINEWRVKRDAAPQPVK